MKFGTRIDEYGYRFSKYFKLVNRFHFQVMALLNITLHKLSMLLAYIMTLYHFIKTAFPKDVVSFSLMDKQSFMHSMHIHYSFYGVETKLSSTGKTFVVNDTVLP